MKINIFTMVFCCIFSSCQFEQEFNREIWINNNSVQDQSNPRAMMLDDLQSKHLRKGMQKSEIIALLGEAHQDGIEYRLPPGVVTPDSLSLVKWTRKSKVERRIALDKYNKWHKENSQPDTLVLYPVGWSLIDPNFLVVKFDGKQIVSDYWVEQH